jgi:hypothetical protein
MDGWRWAEDPLASRWNDRFDLAPQGLLTTLTRHTVNMRYLARLPRCAQGWQLEHQPTHALHRPRHSSDTRGRSPARQPIRRFRVSLADNSSLVS